MLIRSQNKEVIINFDNLKTVRIGGLSGSRIIVFTESEALEIGEYSTEEKAIKVLDMIQDAYARCESSRALTTGTVFEIARKSGTQAVVENFKKGHRDNFVFQMPQDREV